MSAFMVEDRTINTVVTWLAGEIRQLSDIPQQLQELGIDTTLPGWEEKLGQAMFLLNVAGVESRYGKGEAKTFRFLHYQYRVTTLVSFVQVLKSLQCWLYQCSEGIVPETTLYTFFDHEVQISLMKTIIARMPAYQKATWG